MTINDFYEKLSFSLGSRERLDVDLLRRCIPGCVKVTKTDAEMDKTGVDYVAVLRGGATVYIDAKRREANSAKYWKNGEPELALERWSVCPTTSNPGKAWWTVSESTQVDMILFTFDKKDTNRFYLIPFQHLRAAFHKNVKEWEKTYPWKRQWSCGWQSEAMFVPAEVVIRSVGEVMGFCDKAKGA